MSLSVYGTITAEKSEKLNRAAIRFCNKHFGGYSESDAKNGMNAVMQVEAQISDVEEKRAWAYAMCRAFGMKPTVRVSHGWGKYGVSV